MGKTIFHVFDQFRVGGTESRTCQIINHFGRRYRHIICSQKDSFEARRLLGQDTDVSFIRVGSNPRNVLGNIRRFRRTLKTVKPDLLISYAWGAMEWAIANSLFKICPNIHALEGFGNDEIVRQKLRRRLTRMIFLPTCSKVVTCSDFLRQLAVTSWKVPPSRILSIPNGVDTCHFSREPEGTGTRAASHRVTLGIMASLSPLKNHLRLLRALERLPAEIDFLLIVAGDGPQMQDLKGYAGASEKLRGRVDFRGHCSEPLEVLKQIDVFCLSSDTEQMPMAVLEAMATGLPVVSTDVGDVRQMVARENKLFVVGKDNEDLYTERLKDLILNPELRQTIGRANRDKCRRDYAKERMFSRYEKLYDELLG